jgi:hypothetical protein
VSGPTAGIVGRLPAWLAPREDDSTGRRLWRVETVALVLVGLLLAVAAVNDIFWSVHSSARLVADQTTWRHYTDRDYYNVSATPLVVGMAEDVACANATPGAPGERTQICLLLDGPVEHGLRSVVGGWRLPARTGNFPAKRYDCFGEARSKTLCPPG